MFCWNTGLTAAPTPTWNAAFCHRMLLASSGYEKFLQVPLVALVPAKWPAGQTTGVVEGSRPMFATSTALFWTDTRPATCGRETEPQLLEQLLPVFCVLASGAPNVLFRTPAVAVVLLAATVLLMKSRFNASSIETPAPSQPATLSTMMLLVTVT